MHGKGMGLCMLVLGIIFILIPFYTDWNIFIVLGVLMIIKALMMFVMPMCCKDKKPMARPGRKR